MVTSLGMSEMMGPISYEEGGGQVFLGRDYGRTVTHSEKTMQDIDNEVKRIVEEQLQRARRILEKHRDQVEIVTAALLERESIDAEEFKLLMTGEKLPDLEIAVDHSTADDEAGPSVETVPENPAETSAPGDGDADAGDGLEDRP